MRGKIQLWGNRLALSIPKTLAEEAGLTRDAEVDISLIDGYIVISPPEEIAELEDEVTEEDRHPEAESEPESVPNNPGNIYPAISFSPILLPFSIKADSKGRVLFSAEKSLATPIGVFRLQGIAAWPDGKTLKIYHEDEVHEHPLDDKPFAFEASQYSGDVSIKYSKGEGIEVHLEPGPE